MGPASFTLTLGCLSPYYFGWVWMKPAIGMAYSDH